jgi:secondary thiamine-phosphate synthase enzyme
MKLFFSKVSFKTNGELDWKDITSNIEKIITQSELISGNIIISIPGSTGSIITIESEEGLISDLFEYISKIFPPQGKVYYNHEKKWKDGNAHSHLRASLFGSSLSIPFINSQLCLGNWQQIVFLEFDIRPRNRELIVQCIGE